MAGTDFSKTHAEIVGVSDLYIAKVDKDTDTEYVAATPELFAPVADITGTPKINRQTTYYDNKPFNVYVAEGDTELKIIVSGLPANVMAQIFGKYFDETKGVTFDSGEPETPYFALGFKFSMGISDARYYWYYKGVFSGGAEAGTTKKDNIDVKTYELTFTAVTTVHKWDIDGKEQSMKRAFADTTDSNFTEKDNWFKTVIQPATA